MRCSSIGRAPRQDRKGCRFKTGHRFTEHPCGLSNLTEGEPPMKFKFALLALALAFSLTAKAQDEAPGTQSTINVVAPHGCGRASYPVYCYGVPTDQGGT